MRNRAFRVYWLSVRILPVAFMTGALTSLLGGYLSSRSIINAGAAVFLFGGAIWGLANGGFLAWSYIRAGRRLGADGWAEDVGANRVASGLFILLALFFVAVGIGLAYAALKCALPR